MLINSKQFFFNLNFKTLTYVAVVFIFLVFFIQIGNSEICLFVHVYRICVHVSTLCVAFLRGTEKNPPI